MRQMAQRGKALVTKPNNLSLISWAHLVERQNQLLQVVLCQWHTQNHAHKHTVHTK